MSGRVLLSSELALDRLASRGIATTTRDLEAKLRSVEIDGAVFFAARDLDTLAPSSSGLGVQAERAPRGPAKIIYLPARIGR